MKLHIAAGFVLAFLATEAVAEPDVLITWHQVKFERDGGGFSDKTIRETTSKEMQTVIAAIVTYYTESPEIAAAVVEGIQKVRSDVDHQVITQWYPAPSGYVICRAIIDPVGGGAGDKGIESHNSTFTMRLRRDKEANGVNARVTLPYDRGNSHVYSKFWITFMRSEDFDDNIKLCSPATILWSANNNSTQIEDSAHRMWKPW